jgi:hypothetical protein
MGARARNEMGNTYVIKEGIELLILSSPIRLHSNDFPIQGALYMLLEDMKLRENFRLMLEKKNPSKIGEVINEAYIINVKTNRIWRRTTHIGKHMMKRSFRHTMRL